MQDNLPDAFFPGGAMMPIDKTMARECSKPNIHARVIYRAGKALHSIHILGLYTKQESTLKGRGDPGS